MTHVIASVDFAAARRLGLPGEDAALLCTCGAAMAAGDFAQHRRELGYVSGTKDGRALGPTVRGTPFRIRPERAR